MQIFTINNFIHNCPNCKQLRCPSIGEWMNHLWYIHIMGYDSVIKKKRVRGHKKDMDELKGILLTERN